MGFCQTLDFPTRGIAARHILRSGVTFLKGIAHDEPPRSLLPTLYRNVNAINSYPRTPIYCDTEARSVRNAG